MSVRKTLAIAFATIAAWPALAQQTAIASRTPGKLHLLPATIENTQWGFYDNAAKPALRIDSGDSVMMETMNHAHDAWVPGRTMGEIMKMARDNPQRGPHSITGPIFVNGAEPGDTLKVRINKIVPRAFGYNINLPGIAGQFPKEFAQGRIRYLYIDLDRRVIEYLPGVYVPLAPFPGLIGVARKTPGPYTTRPPGEYGGNMDIRDLTEGATIHFPVWVPGGLLWSGDSHAAQGNGEVNVSAVETAFRELNLTIEVVKGTKLEYPRAENRTSWITMGFDPELDRALDRAIDETAKLLVETRKLPLDRARALVATIADCRVSQVVNGTKGVHCFTPKNPSAREDMARPTTETAQHYVSYSATDSVTKSMDAASLALIDFIATSKNMPRVESYGLASIAMDCRVGAARAVHCLLPKRLWNLPN